MKVNRANLLQTLENVSSGLSTREVVEHSTHYCFQNGKVYTYNDEIANIADSPLPIIGAVPAEPLKEMLLRLAEEILEFEQVKGKLIIRGKGQTVKIAMDKKIQLPIKSIETPKKWTRLSEKFSEGLRRVEDCAGRDEAQFDLTCIHLHPDWVEASNKHKFARFTTKTGLKKPVLVRQVSIKQIIELEMVKFAETDQWIHFKNTTGLHFACRRYTDSYPVLTPLTQLTGKVVQFPKGLAHIAERAEVFSRTDPDNNNIKVELTPGAVHIESQGELGSYRGFKKVTYNGQPFSFMISPQMMSRFVKEHPACELCRAQPGNEALKATLGDFVYVVSLIKSKQEEGSAESNGAVVKKAKKKVKNVE